LEGVMEQSLTKTLATKHKLSVPKVYRKYQATFREGKKWSEPIFPDTGGSQLPVQSGQGKCTATLADVKPSCSFLAMRLTSASLRGLFWLGLIESKKTAGFC